MELFSNLLNVIIFGTIAVLLLVQVVRLFVKAFNFFDLGIRYYERELGSDQPVKKKQSTKA